MSSGDEPERSSQVMELPELREEQPPDQSRSEDHKNPKSEREAPSAQPPHASEVESGVKDAGERETDEESCGEPAGSSGRQPEKPEREERDEVLELVAMNAKEACNVAMLDIGDCS